MLGLILAAQAHAPHQYLHDVFKHLTGQNGYEDYVRAGDSLRVSRHGIYESWTPHQYEDLAASNQELDKDCRELARSLVGKTQLEVWMLEAEEFAHTLRYVHTGNLKPVWDPRDPSDAFTLCPEVAGFKPIAKFASVVSFTRTANGFSDDAQVPLQEILTQSSRPTSAGLLASLAMRSVIFGHLDRMRSSWSYANAMYWERMATELLAQPSPIPGYVSQQYQMVTGSTKYLFAPPGKDSFDDPDDHIGIALMRQLTGAARDQFLRSVSEIEGKRSAKMLAKYSGDESGLIEPMSEDAPGAAIGTSPQDLALRFVAYLDPYWDGLGDVFARQRTQIRLLRLHAKIMEYRWIHGHLPDKLSDCALAADLADPFSKSPFQYEIGLAGGYRLYSKGFSDTGEIELTYVAHSAGNANEARP